MIDSNELRGISQFFNPVTGQTTVSICYSEENTDEYFILEYHDGQKFVPFDGQNGIVYKDVAPVEIQYDTETTFYDNIVKEIYLGEVKYVPTNGAVYLPAYYAVNNLNDLQDVNITAPLNGDALIYDSATETWINGAGGGGGSGSVDFWVGTQTQYDAITTKNPGTLYFALDDSIYIPVQGGNGIPTGIDGIIESHGDGIAYKADPYLDYEPPIVDDLNNIFSDAREGYTFEGSFNLIFGSGSGKYSYSDGIALEYNVLLGSNNYLASPGTGGYYRRNILMGSGLQASKTDNILIGSGNTVSSYENIILGKDIISTDYSNFLAGKGYSVDSGTNIIISYGLTYSIPDSGGRNIIFGNNVTFGVGSGTISIGNYNQAESSSGEDTIIGPGAKVYSGNGDYTDGYNVVLGSNAYAKAPAAFSPGHDFYGWEGYSVSIGPGAKTRGGYNISIGLARIHGADSIAIGDGCWIGNTESELEADVVTETVAVGSGTKMKGGGLDVLVGEKVGGYFLTATECLMIGAHAGEYTSSGSKTLTLTNSTYLGTYAGYMSNTTGSDLTLTGRVMIGYQAGYNDKTSNKLYIANSLTATPLIYGEFDNYLLRVHNILQVKMSTGQTAAPFSILDSSNNVLGGFTTSGGVISVVNQKDGSNLKIWYGTEAEYAAIGTPDANTLYFTV